MRKSKKYNNARFLLIGDLQVYAFPYASLYMNEATNSLYIFIRVATEDNAVKGIMAPVTINSIRAYMNKQMSLRYIFQNNKSRLCDIQNDTGRLLWSVPYKNSYKKITENDNLFDASFCYEQYELSYFLNQY